MAKKVGTLIREARTSAGLTQEALAKKIPSLTASDLGRAERGEKELTQDQLKAIAKATGVTQKSLLDAAKGTAAKTSSQKTSSAKKKTSSASSGSTIKVTAAEKKLIELYRAADADTKKAVTNLLKGESSSGSLLSGILGSKKDTEKVLGNLLGNAVSLLNGKKE